MENVKPDKIFNYLKAQLEVDFGSVSEDMVYALRDLILAFPDFIKYFKSCFNMSVIEALEEFIKRTIKNKSKFSNNLLTKHKPKNDIIYYMLLGCFFLDAYSFSENNSRVDQTVQIKNLKKFKKNKFNF